MNAPLDLRRFFLDSQSQLRGWLLHVARDARLHLEAGPSSHRPQDQAAQAVLKEHTPHSLVQHWEAALRAHIAGQLRALSQAPVATAGAASATSPAVATQPLGLLTLKDEQDVEEDMEVSRLVQALESCCEHTLRELRALCSGLRGAQAVEQDAPPLHPRIVATTLGQAVRAVPLNPPARLVLLRAVLPAVPAALKAEWESQLQTLNAAGLQAPGFKVLPDPAFMPTDLSPHTQALPLMGTAVGSGRLQALLMQLWERAGHDPAVHPGPTGAVGDAWMQGMVQAVVQQGTPAPAMQQMIENLGVPGQQLVQAQPEIWNQPEHGWWQLMDRLLLLCETLESRPGGAQDQVAQRCGPAIAQFCGAGVPDSEQCQLVLAQVDQAHQAVTRHSSKGGDDGEEDADMSPGTSGHVPLDPVIELTRMVREQLSQQLRASAAPGSLRRLLLGPWLRVLVAALDPREGDPARAQRYTDWVDQLFEAVRNGPEGERLDTLLNTAREGMAYIKLPDVQIDSWLFDLTMRLHEVAHEPGGGEEVQGWRHDELPTVPVDLHGTVQGARARRDRVAWLRSLRVGDICRLYLDGQWHTLQLLVEPAAQEGGNERYVFRTRGKPGEHVVERRTLELLRSEGLATTVEQGTFLAKSIDTGIAPLGEG